MPMESLIGRDGWDGVERRRVVVSPPEIRIPGWLVGVIVTLLLTVISVAFTMGTTYMSVQENARRIEAVEKKLDEVERVSRRESPLRDGSR